MVVFLLIKNVNENNDEKSCVEKFRGEKSFLSLKKITARLLEFSIF